MPLWLFNNSQNLPHNITFDREDAIYDATPGDQQGRQGGGDVVPTDKCLVLTTCDPETGVDLPFEDVCTAKPGVITAKIERICFNIRRYTITSIVRSKMLFPPDRSDPSLSGTHLVYTGTLDAIYRSKMFINDLANDALAGKFVVLSKKAARGFAMKNQSIQRAN